jgi:hypothetical protein
MKSFYIGQRVGTGKFGDGVVSGFERVTTVITHPTEYGEGDRVAVKLDDPTRWACHSEKSGDPYFFADELSFIWEGSHDVSA